MVTCARARWWSSRARTTSGFCFSAMSSASRSVRVRTSAQAHRANRKKAARAFIPPSVADQGLLVRLFHHAADAVELLAQLALAQRDQDHVDEHDQPRGAETQEHVLNVAIHSFLQI